MLGCTLTFRSYTHAKRGESLLRSRSIPCSIVKAPPGSEGCRSGLAVSCSDARAAYMLCKENGLSVGKIIA